MKSITPVFMIVLMALTGCIGFFFGPGYSCNDKQYFAEPPIIVKKGEQFFLRWSYGSMGFYYQPSYEVREGALWWESNGSRTPLAIIEEPIKPVKTTAITTDS